MTYTFYLNAKRNFMENGWLGEFFSTQFDSNIGNKFVKKNKER